MSKKKRERIAITEGWYGNPDKDGIPPRWVLHRSPTHVLYSRGGIAHFECLTETFERWCHRNKARRLNP